TSWTSGGSVDFTDSAIVIASSRGYWLSKDRGYNWERKPTPLRANNRIPVSVAMKDPDHILILSDWDTVFNFYPQPLCFTTSDGGQTWGQSNVPVSTSFTRYVSGTSNTYITVGFISISGPSGSAISYDGGLSWNTLTGDSYTSVAFLNDSTGYATASNGSFGTNNQGQIYKWDVNCFATSTVENVTVCDSFTWPTTGITYITSGTYADTIQNGFGCDSILVLNLEIAAPVVNVFRNGNTFIAEDLPVSTMHQWLRCDQGFAPINGANTNVYTATEDGQYAVEFTNGSCKDTSECFTACMPLEDSIVQVDDTLMVTTVGATYQWVDCDNGNAPITGATERKYVPMSSGNFGVEISGTLCTYTLDCYNIILSGAEETETKRVRIHPNPVTHWLNIEGDLSNTHTYELYNTMGQMVGSGLIHQQRIDVKDLSGGMYLLRIRNANRVLLGTYQMIKR
ncbi:MAG: T9SS type A sorting domain-containing protein, partial [Bacteroidota bacterium]